MKTKESFINLTERSADNNLNSSTIVAYRHTHTLYTLSTLTSSKKKKSYNIGSNETLGKVQVTGLMRAPGVSILLLTFWFVILLPRESYLFLTHTEDRREYRLPRPRERHQTLLRLTSVCTVHTISPTDNKNHPFSVTIGQYDKILISILASGQDRFGHLMRLVSAKDTLRTAHLSCCFLNLSLAPSQRGELVPSPIAT